MRCAAPLGASGRVQTCGGASVSIVECARRACRLAFEFARCSAAGDGEDGMVAGCAALQPLLRFQSKSKICVCGCNRRNVAKRPLTIESKKTKPAAPRKHYTTHRRATGVDRHPGRRLLLRSWCSRSMSDGTTMLAPRSARRNTRVAPKRGCPLGVQAARPRVDAHCIVMLGPCACLRRRMPTTSPPQV